MDTANLFIFLASILILVYAGGIMVRSLIWTGRYLRLSEYAVSFILAAFATSLPELFVGINAAFGGTPTLSFGNLIGANVLNVTLVIGVAIYLARGFVSERTVTKEDAQIAFGLIMFPVFLFLDGMVSRLDGLLLVFLFGGYVIYLIQQDRREIVVNQMDLKEYRFSNFMKKIAGFSAGTALLLASSYFVVSTGINFAKHFSLPLFFTGILIAIGTTLPEVIFSVRSVTLKHGAMSFGNAVGSIVVNISLILGIVAIIHPIAVTVPARALIGSLFTAGLLSLIYMLYAAQVKIGRPFGVFLIMLAFIFILIEAVL